MTTGQDAGCAREDEAGRSKPLPGAKAPLSCDEEASVSRRERSTPSPAKRGPLGRAFDRLFAVQKREARRVLGELLAVRGLVPLLMKARNGSPWSAAEKAELLSQLRRLSRLSPYLLFLLLPGSALLLPVYAWWLDRRRTPRMAAAEALSVPDSQRP